jgi:hypothetical protein
MTNHAPLEIPAKPFARRFFRATPVRLLLLVLLFISAAWYEAAHAYSLFDDNIWVHLSSGLWILQNHSVPHTGIFSQHPDLPWVVAGWGFDLLVALAYKLLGLRGIPVLVMCFKVILAFLTFRIVRGAHQYFWRAVLLSAACQYVLLNMLPSSALFSVVLLGIELMLLSQSRSSGNVQSLYCLPVLFVFWANLDIGFVYGLLVLALFFIAEFISQKSGTTWFKMGSNPLPLEMLGIITGLSLVASFLSPYSYRPFEQLLEPVYGPVSFASFEALHSMNFRQPQHYVLLLLIMAAFLTLGRQHSRDVFKLGAMLICTAMAFHRQQDIWLVALLSLFVLADAGYPSSSTEAQKNRCSWKWEHAAAAGVTFILLVVAIIQIPSGNEVLLDRVGKIFPVQACKFIRDNHLSGPLFNAYSWGGFLTWYMPDYPVAIDGRNDLYGAELNELYFKVTKGIQPLNTDADFTGAGTLLLERHSPMGEAVDRMSGYNVIYRDDLAIVLERQR